MIASSRPGGLPANLQGIWNHRVQPPWGSNYTTNINTEMNYWMTETANLPECFTPLSDFIRRLSVNGAQTAKINYGMDRGWLAHHNSDAWAQTAPTGDMTLTRRVLHAGLAGHWQVYGSANICGSITPSAVTANTCRKQLIPS